MPPHRIASLDLIRGVAVLGILAINIAGFAGPSTGVLSPNFFHPSAVSDQVAYATSFVLFEGKMRALFAILFGASMTLFIDSAKARGRDGELLQARRLMWLMLFGFLHYFLLWWGDILFAYAASGLVLLLVHRLPQSVLGWSAATLFSLHFVIGFLTALPNVQAEEWARLGQASAAQWRVVSDLHSHFATATQQEMAQYTGGFWHILITKFTTQPYWLIYGAYDNFAEYFGLMTLGLILQRKGFFAQAWPRSHLLVMGIGLTTTGLILTLAALTWLWPRGFPPIAMDTAIRFGLALPHLLIALGYAALLVFSTHRILGTTLGQRIAAAGRMAFSNYIGTSVVMTAIFYGWGLGLFGTIPPLQQWAFVTLGWALMLGMSAPYLSKWKHGPLEWLWRSLTNAHFLPNK